MALVKRDLLVHSIDLGVQDSNALRLATQTSALESTLTNQTLNAVLTEPPARFHEMQSKLGKQLAALQASGSRLASEPRWHSSPALGRDLNALGVTLKKIVAAPSQLEARGLISELLQNDSAFDQQLRGDISAFSTDVTRRSADRLWWYGGLFPGVCAFIVVALTGILLPPALRRIRGANDALIKLEAGSATQAAELEERNIELQEQQKILREHEAELIMKTQQLESTSHGSQQAARRFEELFQGLPVACVGFSEDGRIFEWNRASTELFGFDAYQVLHQDVWKHISDSAFRRRGKSIVRQVFQGKAFKDTEWSYVRQDGQRRHVLGHLFPVRGLDGRILGGIASCLDVTDRKHAENELRSSEKLFRDLIDSLHEGVLLYDHVGRIVVANRQAGVLLGAQRSALIGRRFEQVKSLFLGADSKPLAAEDLPYSQCLKTGEAIEEALVGIAVERQDSGGGIRWFSVNAIPLHRPNEDQPHGVLSSFSEVTERLQHEAQLKDRQGLLEQANTKLEALAVTDGLTGLYNHRAFQERLEDEINGGSLPLSVVLVDVDLFKSYNDSFGHPEGDKVLRQVATILQDSVGDFGIAARYGGEEFGIILPHHDAEAAAKFGDELCLRFSQAPWPNRAITISAGVATIGGEVSDPASLIRASDTALYASKRAGRDRSTHAGSLPTAHQRAA